MDNKTLKEWRLSQNLTQAQAAALTGLTPRHWRKLEAGSTPVSRRLELACYALSKPIMAAHNEWVDSARRLHNV